MTCYYLLSYVELSPKPCQRNYDISADKEREENQIQAYS